MGMAASQARYLALTARKTNVEYEGQQINQARTALANQSANLFNQMLGMGVPTPPSVRDYTTVQYSFSDGYNTEVLSNYYQIGNNDSDYNYVVTTYHNEKVFTGSKKKLNDPQIQATILNNFSYDPTDHDQIREKIVDKAWFDPTDGTFGIETSQGQTSIFRPVTEKENEQILAINKGLGKGLGKIETEMIDVEVDTGNTRPVSADTDPIDLSDTAVKADFTQITDTAELDNIKTLFNDDTITDVTKFYKNTDGQYITDTQYAETDPTAQAATVGKHFVDEPIIETQQVEVPKAKVANIATSADDQVCTEADLEALQELFRDAFTAFGDYSKTADGQYYVTANVDAEGNVDARSYSYLGINMEEVNGKMVASKDQDYYTDGKTFVTKEQLNEAVTKYNKYVERGIREKNNVDYINPKNDRTTQNYTAVGNCRLTELTSSDLSDEDIAATIDQIIKDMQKVDGDQLAAENFKACFDVNDKGELEYKGGIYTFKMGGQVYYTTERDLAASTPTSIVDNDIDVQQKKLNYYQASYMDTRVEDTQKALLETDGKGRFKTMKLEDDSVVYTLNVEEVTDEASYNDAMNQYYYQNAIYEQTLQEINAKTEIIQAQDRTLELRLEQLQTEQSALQNEMEAVKKVVDKHVELGFKTFGG